MEVARARLRFDTHAQSRLCVCNRKRQLGGVSIEKYTKTKLFAAFFLVLNTKLDLEDYRIARVLGVLLVIEE